MERMKHLVNDNNDEETMSDHSLEENNLGGNSCHSTNSASSSSVSGRVSFSNVSVRRYARTISDHPEARGVPIGIDWDYYEESPLSLEDYETRKRQQYESSMYFPMRRNLHLTSITRENILINKWGFSENELRQAEQDAVKVSRLRQRSARPGWLESAKELLRRGKLLSSRGC